MQKKFIRTTFLTACLLSGVILGHNVFASSAGPCDKHVQTLGTGKIPGAVQGGVQYTQELRNCQLCILQTPQVGLCSPHCLSVQAIKHCHEVADNLAESIKSEIKAHTVYHHEAATGRNT